MRHYPAGGQLRFAGDHLLKHVLEGGFPWLKAGPRGGSPSAIVLVLNTLRESPSSLFWLD